ncbi:MAG: hypothetical protein U0132_16950 [Gemmatimonadaceae bacterium]
MSRVFIGSEVVVMARVAPSSATVQRRVIAVRGLARCGAGRYTLLVSTVVRDGAAPERR